MARPGMAKYRRREKPKFIVPVTDGYFKGCHNVHITKGAEVTGAGLRGTKLILWVDKGSHKDLVEREVVVTTKGDTAPKDSQFITTMNLGLVTYYIYIRNYVDQSELGE